MDLQSLIGSLGLDYILRVGLDPQGCVGSSGFDEFFVF